MAKLNYLFIYCEWLDSQLVKQWVPDAEFITTGTCSDHAVRFVSYKDDDGESFAGGCCLSDAPGEILHGVVWKVSEEAVLQVDKLTSISTGRYTRRYLVVKGADGKVYSTVSHSIKNPTGDSKPSQAYMDHMIAGAKEFNFPAEYIAKLEAFR